MQPTPVIDQYVPQAGDVHGDRDTVLSIWRGNLGQEAHMCAKYEWFYLRCPFGTPVLQLLRHAPSNEIAGACAAGRRHMLWRGQALEAGVMVDLAVRAEHRSLGPALMMQKALIQCGLQKFGFVYGFPNPRATAIFRRLGSRKLVDIVRHACVLRPETYLKRRMPAPLATALGVVLGLGLRLRERIRRIGTQRFDVSWSNRADARMDGLWSRSAPGTGLLAIRDARHLRWRFDEAPTNTTRYLLLSTDAGKTLFGWFATQVVDNVLHVRDFWTVDAANGVSTACVDALICAARRLRVSAISVEIACRDDKLSGWRRRGFVERSRRPIHAFWHADIGPGDDSFDLLLTSADEDE
ncbi:hypothetical protein [Luteimonas mephitis]|uniref:hypothetical protein n=1 Tax=Luteimonas mephitis TaxID=83615 RepID=UPI0004178388|nr:hypothetical protein [Luteimonas mephitis]